MALPELESTRVQARKDEGIGLVIPPRRADCSGVRPSWYPFQVNVCDWDWPDPIPYEGRQLTIPPPPS